MTRLGCNDSNKNLPNPLKYDKPHNWMIPENFSINYNEQQTFLMNVINRSFIYLSRIIMCLFTMLLSWWFCDASIQAIRVWSEAIKRSNLIKSIWLTRNLNLLIKKKKVCDN